MQRGSDKHGFRLDDEMAGEVEDITRTGHESRAEEGLSAEPSGEDQPSVGLRPDGSLTGGVPDGVTPEDIAGRSLLATYLGRSVWPATGAQLVAVAREREAPDEVLGQLSALPPGRSFGTVQEAWETLSGGATEHRP